MLTLMLRVLPTTVLFHTWTLPELAIKMPDSAFFATMLSATTARSESSSTRPLPVLPITSLLVKVIF